MSVVRAKDIRSAVLKLSLPCCDLIGVNIELLSQLSECSIAFNRRQCNLRFEASCVVPAWSSAQGLSDSIGTAWPPSGRNSTYPSVQISGTSSLNLASLAINPC
jgi:hypothetical protein